MDRPVRKRRRGVILTTQGLTKLQAAKSEAEFEENAGRRYTLEALSERTGLSLDTLMKVFAGESGVDKQSLQACFRAFKLGLEPGDYTQPELPDEEMPSSSHEIEPTLPGGQVPLDSHFYLERPQVEAPCYRVISQPGALIRIKALAQMGKTSLIARILHQAETLGYRTVSLSFRLAPKNVFQDIDNLLRWFCINVSLGLQLPNKLSDYWDDSFGSKVSSKVYFERYLLEQRSQPIVLALDEVDLLFHYPDLTNEFLGLLRSWHEEAKNRDIWKKLRLVVTYSTEMPIPPIVNQSPLNVGLLIELKPFTKEQVQQLVNRYGLDWSPQQVEQLTDRVEGHPCLVQVALYYAHQQMVTLEELLQKPLTSIDIFTDYLQQQARFSNRVDHLLEKTPNKADVTEINHSSGSSAQFESTGMLRASAEGLAIVDLARHRKGWTKIWTSAWWQAAQTSQATLRDFWNGQPIATETLIALCRAVGVVNWEAVVDQTPALSPQPVSDDTLLILQENTAWEETVQEESFFIPSSSFLPELPEGCVRLGSPFYVERSLEPRCYQAIARPGALIRIKAPRQMGKTSLMSRIVHQANRLRYRTVRLNLRQAEGAVFTNLNLFLRWFLACVSQKLQIPAPLDDYWDQDRGGIFNCTTYMQDYLLEELGNPLVLALDEVDCVFASQEIAQGFFSMLRIWHEEAKTIDIWEQLRLIVAHSTEDYGRLDINQSPFNVGLPVELGEFTPEQIATLARCHELNWTSTQVEYLMSIVGGHPYLTRLAFYHLACQDVTLDQLLSEAITNTGIYEEHLRRHLIMLNQQPELAAAFHQVVTQSEPARLDTTYTYKLYSMGLIKRQGDRVLPRCELYRQYFQHRLVERDS
jgi:transcriptional regulator with XRE-family HTH domain